MLCKNLGDGRILPFYCEIIKELCLFMGRSQEDER